MKVQQLAQQEKVSRDTIRYYVRIGLLTPQKNESGYHLFTNEDQKRLRFILHARELGFTLEDIKLIINESSQGLLSCPTVRKLIERRLIDTKKRLFSMQQLVERMENAIIEWQKHPDCNPSGEHICNLIEGVYDKKTSKQGGDNDAV